MPETYDRTVIDGRIFSFAAGIERFREGMKQYFPREGRSIGKYIRTLRAVNRVSGLYYAEKAIPAPAAALAGSLLRAPFLRWAKRSRCRTQAGRERQARSRQPMLGHMLELARGDLIDSK